MQTESESTRTKLPGVQSRIRLQLAKAAEAQTPKKGIQHGLYTNKLPRRLATAVETQRKQGSRGKPLDMTFPLLFLLWMP
ncbi:hypothetical protein AGOR_G00177410 [Albula goreensis]|uniref:Uncharacterized protein n=1 Tax=Albula goreensis TaxID=1534307 RepID=A0A8T3D012_9TELE|nr:hypothetical protein AGOR_G00177410 [Albula goreensis]